LEFYGFNPDNKSGHSEKYWELTSDGATVTRRNGRFGARCKGAVVSLAKGVSKAYEKLAKGYRPVAGH
jgi:predicted DNA-binding WGR domain protein